MSRRDCSGCTVLRWGRRHEWTGVRTILGYRRRPWAAGAAARSRPWKCLSQAAVIYLPRARSASSRSRVSVSTGVDDSRVTRCATIEFTMDPDRSVLREHYAALAAEIALEAPGGAGCRLPDSGRPDDLLHLWLHAGGSEGLASLRCARGPFPESPVLPPRRPP